MRLIRMQTTGKGSTENEIISEAQRRDWGTSEDDLAAYGEIAGAAGGAAGCTAVGAAPASPLCAYVGGKVGEFVGRGVGKLVNPNAEAEARKRRQIAQSRAYDAALQALNDALFEAWDGAVARTAAVLESLGAQPAGKAPASWALAEYLPHMGHRSDLTRNPGGFTTRAHWGARKTWTQESAPIPEAVFSDAMAPQAYGVDAGVIVKGRWGPAVAAGVEQVEAFARQLREAEVRAAARAMAEASEREGRAVAQSVAGLPESAWPPVQQSVASAVVQRRQERRALIIGIAAVAGAGTLVGGAWWLLTRKRERKRA